MIEFVDTNVLLYASDSDAVQKQPVSIALLERLLLAGTGALSVQVLMEFYSNATRKFRMTSLEAETVIEGLAKWRIHRPDHSSVMEAIHLQRRYNLAWFDSMILNSALETGSTVLWTEDFSDGQRFGGLVVRNPYKNSRIV